MHTSTCTSRKGQKSRQETSALGPQFPVLSDTPLFPPVRWREKPDGLTNGSCCCQICLPFLFRQTALTFPFWGDWEGWAEREGGEWKKENTLLPDSFCGRGDQWAPVSMSENNARAMSNCHLEFEAHRGLEMAGCIGRQHWFHIYSS